MSTKQARSNASLLDRYGPWAVVTGASSGIGQAIARRLAAAGFSLVIVARNRDALAAMADELQRLHGVAVTIVDVDLSRFDDVEAMAQHCASLDIGLFCAAAGFGTSGPFLNADTAEEMAMLDVNCRAVLLQTLYFSRCFVARGRGGIVLMGSLVGFQGTPYAAHYAATKAYVQTLAEGLAVELAPSGVDVVASAPGPVHSGFAARAGMKMGAALSPDTVARATLAALGRRTTVLPGALTKLLSYSLVPLPRSLRARIMGRVMRGMTRHRLH